MQNNGIENDGNMRPFLDALLCFICVLAAIVSLLHVSTETEEESIKNNVVFKIVLSWPVGADASDDIDLWVKDPHNHICGYKRREGGAGSLMSLNHDDIGTNQTKEIEEHIEVINIRGSVVGEYVVNCYLYAKRESKEFTEVTAKLVKMKPFEEVIERKVKVFENGDERTFFRFSLDKDANVINTNELPAAVAKL